MRVSTRAEYGLRALLVDGALAIKRAPGGGVEVLLQVPVSPVADPLGVQR